MSDDPKLREMLGLPSVPTPRTPTVRPARLDMSRVKVYAVPTAAEAMGLFKATYNTESSFCITAPIGGKTKVTGWLVGFIPEEGE